PNLLPPVFTLTQIRPYIGQRLRDRVTPRIGPSCRDINLRRLERTAEKEQNPGETQSEALVVRIEPEPVPVRAFRLGPVVSIGPHLGDRKVGDRILRVRLDRRLGCALRLADSGGRQLARRQHVERPYPRRIQSCRLRGLPKSSGVPV